MKKTRVSFAIILICVAALLFSSCESKKEEGDMSDMFFGEYVTNDTETLESGLTKEYDLNELRAFFKGSNANENIGFGTTAPALTFSEVNDKYPVEVLRTGGYSVYKVSQGGYFYVFWIKPYVDDTNQSSEPSVYFSAYLPSDISPELFDSLTPGISTAEDVRKIDPSFELVFYFSNGIFSYSYINDETVLQIAYEQQENINGYDDLIVKEKKIVARTSAPTKYSTVLSSDLP